MSKIRLTDDQLQTPDGAELAQICRAILRPGKLDLNGIKALRKWLRAHRQATSIPAITYLTELMERITADGFINQQELAELKAALIAVLPETPRRSTVPPPRSKPEPWWTFTWMPKWGWWACGGWALIAFFMLLLTVVQSKKADRPDAPPEVAEREPIGGQDTKEDQDREEANTILKEIKKLKQQIAEQKKQAEEDAQKKNPQGNIPENFERITEAVVRIDCNDPSGGGGHGSGFVVAKDVIVTNYHVAGYSSKAEITFRDGTTVHADGKLHLDKSKDIAILRVTKIPPTVQPLDLLNGYPEQVQSVIAIGHPLGANYSTTQGVVGGVLSGEEVNKLRWFGQGHEGTWVQHDAAIYGGNSGGPLINEKGQVVGMNTFGSANRKKTDNNFTFSISSVDMRDALKDAQSAPLVPFEPHDPNDVLSRFIGEWDVVASGFQSFEPAHLTVEYTATASSKRNRVQIDLTPQNWLLLRDDRRPDFGTAEDLVITATDTDKIKKLKKQIAGSFTPAQIPLNAVQEGDFYKIFLGKLEFVWDVDRSSLYCVNDDKNEKVFAFFNEDHWLYVNDRGASSTVLKVKRSSVPAIKHIPDLVVQDESAGGRPALENIEDALKTETFWDALSSQSDAATLDGKPFSGWARSDFGIYGDFTGNFLLGKFDDGLLTRLIRWQKNGIPQFDLNFSGALVGDPASCYFWTIDLQASEVPYFEDLNGMCTEWHANGKKREQSWFVNGKPNRMHHGWHENGEKQYDFNWRSGKAHGTFRQYHKNGQLSHEGRHNGGKLMEVKSWLADGKPGRLTRVTDGSGRWVKRYADESIESSRKYRDGKLHGWYESYFPSGQLRLKLSYNNGNIEGDAWRWHPNGQKAAEGKYAAGKPIGDWKYWDASGKRVSSPNQKLAAQQEETEKNRIGARTTIPAEKLKVTVSRNKILFRTSYGKATTDHVSPELLEQAMGQGRERDKGLIIWDEYGVSYIQEPRPMLLLRVQAYEKHNDPLYPWSGELLVEGKRFSTRSHAGDFLNASWTTIKNARDGWVGYEKKYGRFLIRAWLRDGKLYQYDLMENNL